MRLDKNNTTTTTTTTTSTCTTSNNKMTVLTKAVIRYKVVLRLWSVALVLFLSWNVWLNAVLVVSSSQTDKEAAAAAAESVGGKQSYLSEFAAGSSSKSWKAIGSFPDMGSPILKESDTMTTTTTQSTTKRSPPASQASSSSSSSSEAAATALELGLSLPLEQDSFSACLLVKDDNDLLNEWIAYHYHTIQLRTLIVAIDPSSTTSPSSILKKWKTSTDLRIQEWTDPDYMPQFFLQGKFHLIPDFMSRTSFNNRTVSSETETNTTETTTEDWEGELEEDEDEEEDEDATTTINDEAWKLHVNSHRFRQSTFVQKCAKMLWQQNKTWMTHIDTDEFLVLHPKVRQQDEWRKIPVDSKIGPSSLLLFLKAAARTNTKALNYPCISMPRLLYGSVVTTQEDEDDEEDENDINNNEVEEDGNHQESVWNETKNGIHLETLRWKYHSNFDKDSHLNGRPKVIMDLSGVPSRANFLRERIYSIHRPALHLCRSMQSVTFEQKWKFPLTVNHYLGDWNRYSSRHDPRRTREKYDAKANLRAGKDDDWIDNWITSFAEVHGLERASHLLDVNVIQLNKTVALRTIDDAPKVRPKLPRSFDMQTFDALERDTFSACMIIKDDNRILNEWFAYHYHTLGLRYVIVTVDPDSETSPFPIFDKWRKFGMIIDVWTDQMFMPDIFFKHQYHLMPQLVKLKKNKHKWVDADKEEDPAETLKLTRKIQDHRFRQLVFLSNCTRELRAKNRTWMVHIDTDEYIVINPKLRKRGKFGDVVVPLENGPSVVPRLLNEMVKTASTQVNYPCISLPRLMFGSVEDGKDSTREIPTHLFNLTKFESLRWKYHASFDDSDRNKQPKVIMDVSAIPEDDPILTDGKVFSIHRPSGALCRMQGQMDFDSVLKYPLSANHYLGTFERFGSRDDPRRNRRLYDQKADVREGKDDDWMDGWLKSFVDEHGVETVSNLLNDYVVNV